MIDLLLHHHPLAVFLGCLIVVCVLQELYCWLFPQKRASNHWRGEIGFKANPPQEDRNAPGRP